MSDGNSQAKAQLASVIEMVEALAKAEEDKDDDAWDEAERAIHEDALEITVRSDWQVPGRWAPDEIKPIEYRILLCTGGPAVRIIGELNEHGEPSTADLQYRDSFQPWSTTHTFEEEKQAMLRYAQCFYWGE